MKDNIERLAINLTSIRIQYLQSFFYSYNYAQSITFYTLFFCFSSAVRAQKATEIVASGKLPQNDDRLKVFLAGSIDMGKTKNGQTRIGQDLTDQNVILLNPHREDWDKEWQLVSSDPNYRKQVEWALSALEYADFIIMYCAPGSQSRISLLEYGLFAKSNKLLVLNPKGFWRKGNMDITSKYYNIKTFDSLDEMMVELQKIIRMKSEQ